MEDGRQPRSGRGIRDADDLPSGAGRVRQRADQVERRPHPDLASRRAGVLHRRVETLREEEREAVVAQGRRRRLGVMVDPDAERVEHIGRARSRRHRAVAMLGHGDPRGRDHECRGRRDVERPAVVAAGPAGVDGAVRRRDRHDPLAHRGREPGELVDGLAAHPQGDEKRGQECRRRLAVHDAAHRRAGLAQGQGPTFDHGGQRRPDLVAHRTVPTASASARPAVANEPVALSSRDASPSPARRRKFASRCGPCGVRTDSGWNWTPSSGRAT